MTRAVEERVLVKVGARAAEEHVVTMAVLVRVVTRVEEMMTLVNLERVEDANASVIAAWLPLQHSPNH